MLNNENASNGIFCLVAGIGIGLAAGLLWAPNTGEATRRRLREKASEQLDEFQASVDNLKQRGSQLKEDAIQRGTQMKEDARQTLEQAKEAVHRQKVGVANAVEAGKKAYQQTAESPVAM
jgi:gas vesicle protein